MRRRIVTEQFIDDLKTHELGVGWMVSDSIAVASFAALPARSLPGMLECPGTHSMKTDDETDNMH